jgi:hypothetical protein
MADSEGGSSSNSVGIVAILIIFIMVVALGFLAFRSGVFGGGTKKTEIDVNVTKPK